MKKIVGVIAIVILLISILFLVKTYIGDLRPALLPNLSLNKFEPVPVTRGNALDVPLQVPEGYQVGIFVDNAGGLRDMTFSPQGVLLVSDAGKGNVYAMPDLNNDGIADDMITVLTGLRRPHGLAFYKNNLYVAEEDGVSRYIWAERIAAGALIATARLDKQLFPLPKGDRHVTRSIVFSDNGTLYVSVGSTCDVCEEKDPFLGAVIVSNWEGITPKVFAKGLRNAVFITFHPRTHELWGTEMGRDMLGDETPADEINIISDGKDYGWPKCYGKNMHDGQYDKALYKVKSGTTICETLGKTGSLFDIPAHSAPLGLTFITSSQFQADWQGDLLVAYHGSWNRSSPTGYKVVRLDVSGDTITGSEDFLTGFLQGGTAVGRPVDVIFDSDGNLYVSDDKAGKIYIISKK